MASKQPSKLRVVGLIVIGALIVYSLLTFFTGKSAANDTVKVRVSGAPALASVPGSVKDNPRYKELQEQSNEKRADQARKSGKSALPTLVNKTEEGQSDEDFFRNLKKPPEEPEAVEQKPKADPLKKAQEDAERRLKDQQARLDKLKKDQEDKRKAAENARNDAQKNQQNAKELEARIGTYLSDMSALNKVYGPSPKQKYVAGNPIDLKNTQNNAAVSTVPPLYKAGTIIYGVIETSYNSDDPGPILARITTGPLAGSRLIGTASNPASDWSAGLKVVFNTMSRPLAERSQGINLTAVDPQTFQPAIASSSNYHYGQRYGALLMSGVISQGADQATSGSTSSTSSTSSTTTTSDTSTDGLSSIGTPVADDIINNLNKVASRPATYRIEQGTAVGLLFVNDFILEA